MHIELYGRALSTALRRLHTFCAGKIIISYTFMHIASHQSPASRRTISDFAEMIYTTLIIELLYYARARPFKPYNYTQ